MCDSFLFYVWVMKWVFHVHKMKHEICKVLYKSSSCELLETNITVDTMFPENFHRIPICHVTNYALSNHTCDAIHEASDEGCNGVLMS